MPPLESLPLPPRAPLPLRYRLPNPPPVFVGRRREILELARRIQRAPVSVVRGLGGMGKTALVLATIHQRFGARVEDVALIRLVRAADAEPTWDDLTRVLAARLGGQAVGHERPTGEDFVAAIIDLAERAGLWLVLDDVHAAGIAFTEPLLRAFAAYARSSRLIAISREEVPGVPSPQHLVLEGLADREQTALAVAIAPGLGRARVTRAVRSAAGSPWRLLEALAGRDPRDPALASHLPAGARTVLERLAVIEMPIDDATLEVLGGHGEARAALERGGLLERLPAGMRLHDLARAAIDRGAQAARATEVGAVLAARPEPRLALEGARLLLSSGSAPAAADALTRAGEAALAAGEAARLWTLIEDSRSARSSSARPSASREVRNPSAGSEGDATSAGSWLSSLRVRCAVELGRPEAALDQGAPAVEDRVGRLWWARALFQAGRVALAAEEAARLPPPAAGAGEGLAVEAALLHARCLGTLGRFAETLTVLDQVLDQIPTSDDDRRTLVAAHRARWALHVDPVAARQSSEALAQRLPRRPDLRRETAERLAGTFVMLGRLRGATHLLPELRDADRPELFMSREIALWRLAVVTFSGAAGDARHLGERLRKLQAAPPSQTQYARLLALPTAIAAGEALDDLPAAIDRLTADAAACGHAQIYQLAAAWRAKLALVRGERTLSDAWSPSIPAPAGLEALHLGILSAQHACRWVEGLSPASLPPLAGAGEEFVSVAIAHAVALAESAILSGDAEQAAAHATRACALATEHDQLLLGADAQLALCEATLVGARGGLEERAAALEGTARALELPRFLSEARWFAALAAPGGVDGATLERCATDLTAPAAARRARALLTGDDDAEALDRLDRAVIAAARRTGAHRLTTIVPRARAATWTAGWGIDTRARTIWLPDGARIDLTATPLAIRLLDVIAQRGGIASKEVLTCTVWEEREYNPLRHDKRLQVAVLRLRKLMEKDPSRPARLVTTADGYAFGPDEPVRHLRGV